MRKSFTIRLLAISLVTILCLSMTSCEKKAKKTEPEEETSTSESTIVTTTEPTTSLTEFSGPMTNDEAVTWSETSIEPTTYYASVSQGEFLRVRKGPGTEYEIAGSLTRNQQIVIVATTSTGWAKTQDGFYTSSTYLSATPVT